MALTKVSGPLLHGSNDNLGNYVINNITGAAATFTGNVSVGGTLTYDDVTNVDSVGIITANNNIHVEDFLIHKGDTNTKVGFSSAKTFEAISNGSTRFRVTDTDIQILYAASAHKVGIGRSDLVAKLDVKNNSNIPVLKLDDSHNNKYLTIRGGGSPNRMIIDSFEGGGGGAAIDLASNGDTKLRVTSGGAVAIGTDSAVSDTKLDVLGNVVFGPRQHTGNTGNNTGIASIRGHFVNAAGDFGQLYFSNSESSGGGTGAKALISGMRDGVSGGNYGAGLAFHTEYRDPSAHSPKLRMLISGLGIIGINTNGPTAYFDIATNAGTYDNLRLRRIDSGSSGNSDWSLKPYGGNLFFRIAGATDKVVFTDDPRVGIGTATPSGALHTYVDGATQRSYFQSSHGHSFIRTLAKSTAENSGLEFYSGTSNIANVTGVGTGGLLFEVGGDERLRITSGGQLFVGGNTGYNESSSLISFATDDSAGANMLSNSSAIYNHNNPAFLHIQNRYNTGTGQEAGIILHSKSSYNGSWAIYSKRTSSNYLADLVFRNRTASNASAERLRIDSSGRVGINTDTHPDTSSALSITNGQTGSDHCILDIRCNDNETSRIYFSETSTSANGSIRYRYTGDDNYMSFYTNGSSVERLRIGSDGTSTFDVGAPSSSNKVIGRFQAQSSRQLDIVWHDSGSLMGFNTPQNHNYIFKINDAEKFRLTSESKIIINNPDTSLGQDQLIGGLEWIKNDASGAGIGTAGGLKVYSDDSYGARSYMTFSVRQNSNDEPQDDTEFVRLTSGGRLRVRCQDMSSDPGSSNRGVLIGDTSSGCVFSNGSSTGFSNNLIFMNGNGVVGKIETNGSNTNYNESSSDRTLKKNFENWTEEVLPNFKNLNPQKFNFLPEDDSVEKTKGFIAQDLAEHFPRAYPLDPLTGKYNYNPSGMVVYLMKALQEEIVKREALEARISALEGS